MFGVRWIGAVRQAWDNHHRAWGANWQEHQPWRGDDLPPDQGQLRWRQVDDGWRLDGQFAPAPRRRTG
ncbi:MAG TPA: hypothetical protein VGH89_01190 [Pseudonocardia sp.]|jgi:hypothetical protein